MEHYISALLYTVAFALGSKVLMAIAMVFTFYQYVIVKTNREFDNIK